MRMRSVGLVIVSGIPVATTFSKTKAPEAIRARCLLGYGVPYPAAMGHSGTPTGRAAGFNER
jgi:hypothetical protein